MGIDINAETLEITMNMSEYISYRGHAIQISDEEPMRLWCGSCGNSESVDGSPEGLHKWETVCYLLGMFGDCNDDGDLQEQISDRLSNYIGKPACRSTYKAIEGDVRNIVGYDASVNIQGRQT